MKTETVTIRVKRYTDDDENPVCGGCCFGDNNPASCWFSETGEKPGKSCPVWHNTVKPKWATFKDWLIAGGYITADTEGCPPELLREMVAWGAARK